MVTTMDVDDDIRAREHASVLSGVRDGVGSPRPYSGSQRRRRRSERCRTVATSGPPTSAPNTPIVRRPSTASPEETTGVAPFWVGRGGHRSDWSDWSGDAGCRTPVGGKTTTCGANDRGTRIGADRVRRCNDDPGGDPRERWWWSRPMRSRSPPPPPSPPPRTDRGRHSYRVNSRR